MHAGLRLVLPDRGDDRRLYGHGRVGQLGDGTFTVTVTSTPNTPVGVDITVIPVDATTGTTPVTIHFSEVTDEGMTTLVTSHTGPPPPHGFTFLGTYYEIHTTAAFDSAQVCFTNPLVNGQPRAVGHFDGATGPCSPSLRNTRSA